MKSILLPVWKYRFFIVSTIKTEFFTKFSRSKFGGLWTVLHPLAQVLIYALILSQIMKAKLPGVATQYGYPIFLLSGIVAWTLFSEVMSRSLTVFISNGELLKKISFPKLTLPIIVVGGSIMNFMTLLFIMYIVFIFLGHFPYQFIYWLPLLLIITVALAIGIGLFFGVLNVFIRDIGEVMNIVLQFWFWLTPIVYMMPIIPEKYHWMIMANPMTGVTLGFQNVLLYDKAPDLELLIYPSSIAAIFLLLFLTLFKKASREMADVL